MSINVYWTSSEKEWILATPPENVISTFHKKDLIDPERPDSHIHYCPAFNSNFKNVYTMKSLYDYEFTLENDRISSTYHDQSFFENHVIVRSAEKRFFSFMNSYLFFTDEPSLKVTFYEYPCLEDNNITQRCMPVAGQFDIGKWFRETEFAFYLKDSYQSFKIEKDEVYGYMRFHTDEKINFIEFDYTDRLRKIHRESLEAVRRFSRFKKLEQYYRIFRHKKVILKEIKENIF